MEINFYIIYYILKKTFQGFAASRKISNGFCASMINRPKKSQKEQRIHSEIKKAHPFHHNRIRENVSLRKRPIEIF